MLTQPNKSPASLFQLYSFIEQLIELNAKYAESDETEDQIDFLLTSEQNIISELAESAAGSILDLKHKISILFGESGICGRPGDTKIPMEQLALSVLRDLDRMTIANKIPARLAESA